MRLLFVCTGNICRSPVAERLMLGYTDQILDSGPGPSVAQIISAGTHVTDTRPMDPNSARALSQLGGDPADFRSRRLTGDLVRSADLVLTMSRRHRHEALTLDPRGLRRTFTLAEAADLLEIADLTDLAVLPVEARAGDLSRRLDAARALRTGSGADDIRDPMGQRSAVHVAVAARIDRAIRPLAQVLFTGVRSHRSTPVPA